MDHSAINQLDMFLEDVGFPTDKASLVAESLDAPLSHAVRDAIALLPEGEYLTREEVRRELIGLPDHGEKESSHHADDGEDLHEISDEKSEEPPEDMPLPEREASPEE